VRVCVCVSEERGSMISTIRGLGGFEDWEDSRIGRIRGLGGFEDWEDWEDSRIGRIRGFEDCFEDLRQ
jgi:hypothetical protein